VPRLNENVNIEAGSQEAHIVSNRTIIARYGRIVCRMNLYFTEKSKIKRIFSVVLQDFCKLALDYLQKGPNVKLYNAAARKYPDSQNSLSRIDFEYLLQIC